MASPDNARLLFGPYRTPRFRYGATVFCEMRGYIEIVGLSTGRIPWPIGKRGRGRRSLVVYKGLAKAVQREASVAICHWWGITAQTVTKWRKALDVGRMNEGTTRVFQLSTFRPAFIAGRKKAHAKARDPVRCAKIAAAKMGKKRPPHVIQALIKANLGRKPSEETLKKMSAAHLRRGTRPPKAGRPWTKKENRLIRLLPAAEVAARTNRTLLAVYSQRRILGLPDGRRRD
jgi:hypothetical protein